MFPACSRGLREVMRGSREIARDTNGRRVARRGLVAERALHVLGSASIADLSRVSDCHAEDTDAVLDQSWLRSPIYH